MNPPSSCPPDGPGSDSCQASLNAARICGFLRRVSMLAMPGDFIGRTKAGFKKQRPCNTHERFEIRRPPTAEEPWVLRCGRAHTRARHRGEHGDHGSDAEKRLQVGLDHIE